jgi:hypothetical protein
VLPGGRVRVSFKAPWRSGTAHADMDAHQFIARLCALVPPPGFHMTRYYGVFASHHRLRERVIPKPAAPPPPQLPLDFDPAESSPTSSPTSSPRPRRIGWAKLLARVFAQGITRCRKCGGRMRVLEVVSDPGRHRPHLARRPRSACASSSRPAPVAPLTARPFGDVFTLPRPAAVLAAPLGLLAAHFVTRALPLAPWTVPKSSDRGLRRSPPDRSALTLAPKFLHQNP